MGPETLAQVLGKLPKFMDEDLLVGIDTADDAAEILRAMKEAGLQTRAGLIGSVHPKGEYSIRLV